MEQEPNKTAQESTDAGAVSAFVEAAGALAGRAVERGDLAEARRLLDQALRAIEGAGLKTLRLVT